MGKLLDLLYPPRCILCRTMTDSSAEPVCDRCAELLLREQTVVRRDRHFTVCVAPFRYAEKVRESIHRFKFGGRSFYAKTYGAWLAACVRRELDGKFDLITWTPVSRKRRRERGYDQAELLCRETAALLGLTPVRCLTKVRHNPAQSGLHAAEERRSNVLHAYEPYRPEAFRGRRILLIDDIITTGATMSECAKTLRAAGAASVVCAALAATE